MLRWASVFGVLMVAPLSAQEPLPEPAAAQQVIYESPFIAPLFVPAEVLLEEARTKNPPTPQGWIVLNRPIRSPDEVFTVGGFSPSTRKYLLQLRRYDSQIRLAKAEIASIRRRLAHYAYFNETNVLFATVEKLSLTLLHAEEHLKELQHERTAFLREHHIRKQFPFVGGLEEPVSGNSTTSAL